MGWQRGTTAMLSAFSRCLVSNSMGSRWSTGPLCYYQVSPLLSGGQPSRKPSPDSRLSTMGAIVDDETLLRPFRRTQQLAISAPDVSIKDHFCPCHLGQCGRLISLVESEKNTAWKGELSGTPARGTRKQPSSQVFALDITALLKPMTLLLRA